ncbi:serine/threonine-protein kinase grp [Thrips palmi]|uniref:non-specific serine/threonine protein kinase n=1 Tax=Thrips palmi TaxID=161013 RepID=A0A6P9AF24_THRPL|nr:serine/threonine-protein kinase grp [Thrips palmi]XP_034256074.1 serine/threonine-protein kinase grp [Thrips palmi]XP_034256075.1 serine/threonine-protein kinase grp [Thrips palmi]XP_034256076.1 serine/threonine-protein kinase grp [Thrips palmi]
MVSEFVDGWTIAQTLGEGAYGEVKLLLNNSTGEAVAMKIIDLHKHPDARTNVKKEVAIHRLMSNSNVIQFYGQRREGNLEYLFLEYAAGGELFDRIEPDVGMAQWEAQKYFMELISGVEYLHSHGVAHRDLKPENLLLDEHLTLKISDFGMATIFRMNGKERCLEKRCGTLPYVAPEVLMRAYHAEPADIWSCGVILVAMLAGELPWDKPTVDCPEYLAWKDGKSMGVTPWSKLDNMILSLVRKILIPLPSGRYSIQKIKNHRWFQKKLQKNLMSTPDCGRPGLPKRLCSGSDLSPPFGMDDTRLCQSQPDHHFGNGNAMPNDNSVNGLEVERPGFSFSQPAQIEDLLLSSQLNPTQHTQSSTGSQNVFQRLVRRMTRFFVRTNVEDSEKLLCNLMEKLGSSWKVHTPGVITITTVDRRKMQLIFKSSVIDMDGKTLLDFRLSKGCGLEFKRLFLKIRTALGDAVLKGPVMWPIAIATNSVP